MPGSGVSAKITVKGMQKVQRKLDQVHRDLVGGPMFRAMRDAAMLVTRSGRKNAPVKTGRLRASITPAIKNLASGGIMGIVGSNVRYAPYQEFGTKYMPGKFYLRRAVEENQDRILKLLHSATVKIVAK